MSQTLLTRPAAPVADRSRPGLLLAVLLIGQFMAILDVSVVNVAAATIRTDLHASGAALQLIIAGYTIAYAVALITGARLGDRLAHRRVFLAGLALFTLASLACGLAWSTPALIGLRFAQGLGAALMVPQVLSLIQRNFAGPARARALGLYAAVIAGGAILGQVIGGLLVSADLWGSGWRPVFLVNVPVGALLLVLGRPPPAPGQGRAGARAGPGRPGHAVRLGAAAGGAAGPRARGALAAVGLADAGRLGARLRGVRAGGAAGRDPLVPAAVLRAPGIRPALGAIFATMAGYAGYLFGTALYLQVGLGYTALRAGLSFVVGAVFFGLASLNWRRLPARWQPALPTVGVCVGAVGLLLVALGVRGGNGPGALFWIGQIGLRDRLRLGLLATDHAGAGPGTGRRRR